MRRRALLIVATIILATLALGVLSAAVGVAWYVLSGSLDIPYPDGPPSPSPLP
jgi:hypothetical protein